MRIKKIATMLFSQINKESACDFTSKSTIPNAVFPQDSFLKSIILEIQFGDINSKLTPNVYQFTK